MTDIQREKYFYYDIYASDKPMYTGTEESFQTTRSSRAGADSTTSKIIVSKKFATFFGTLFVAISLLLGAAGGILVKDLPKREGYVQSYSAQDDIFRQR